MSARSTALTIGLGAATIGGLQVAYESVDDGYSLGTPRADRVVNEIDSRCFTPTDTDERFAGPDIALALDRIDQLQVAVRNVSLPSGFSIDGNKTGVCPGIILEIQGFDLGSVPVDKQETLLSVGLVGPDGTVSTILLPSDFDGPADNRAANWFASSSDNPFVVSSDNPDDAWTDQASTIIEAVGTAVGDGTIASGSTLYTNAWVSGTSAAALLRPLQTSILVVGFISYVALALARRAERKPATAPTPTAESGDRPPLDMLSADTLMQLLEDEQVTHHDVLVALETKVGAPVGLDILRLVKSENLSPENHLAKLAFMARTIEHGRALAGRIDREPATAPTPTLAADSGDRPPLRTLSADTLLQLLKDKQATYDDVIGALEKKVGTANTTTAYRGVLWGLFTPDDHLNELARLARNIENRRDYHRYEL